MANQIVESTSRCQGYFRRISTVEAKWPEYEVGYSLYSALKISLYRVVIYKRSVLRRQSRDTNRNIKRLVYCQYG